MNLTQDELDALNNSTTDGLFEENKEEEEVEEVEPVKVEEEVSASTEEDAVADKARVPYSRFETVNEEKIRAQERVKYLEEQISTSKTPEVSQETELPNEWVELYGDSDAAKRAYGLQMKINEDLQEKATQRAIERIDSRGQEEKKALESNLESIESSLSDFSESLGRKLSETEENAILDIQDEFTQKDSEGNYIAPLLSPEKAFEVYTLRQDKTVSSKKQAKNRVLSVTGASSESDISSSSADYNAQNWGSWRNDIE